MPKVSVVVTVYNTSRYLPQCVDSLVSQTLKDVEFIFVDDGSTDDSVEILEQYRKKDERVKILRQENMHAGVARNNGMKQATGKYIFFCDSDDRFDRKLLEMAFCCAEKNRAEIVFFGHYRYDDQTGEIIKCPFNMRKGVFSGESLGENMLTLYEVAPWNKLYLRSFIVKHHLEYQSMRRHEDVSFGLLAVILAERIVCLNKRLVYYRVNNSESLQRRNIIAYPYLIECYSELKKTLMALGRFHGNTRKAYNKCLSSSIERRTRSRIDVMLSKQYYSEMKKNLIPNLFESPKDFTKDVIIPGIIHESKDYENYLKLLVERLAGRGKEKRLRESKDYIIGHALLAIPRKIKHAVWAEKRKQ